MNWKLVGKNWIYNFVIFFFFIHWIHSKITKMENAKSIYLFFSSLLDFALSLTHSPFFIVFSSIFFYELKNVCGKMKSCCLALFSNRINSFFFLFSFCVVAVSFQFVCFSPFDSIKSMKLNWVISFRLVRFCSLFGACTIFISFGFLFRFSFHYFSIHIFLVSPSFFSCYSSSCAVSLCISLIMQMNAIDFMCENTHIFSVTLQSNQNAMRNPRAGCVHASLSIRKHTQSRNKKRKKNFRISLEFINFDRCSISNFRLFAENDFEFRTIKCQHIKRTWTSSFSAPFSFVCCYSPKIHLKFWQ